MKKNNVCMYEKKKCIHARQKQTNLFFKNSSGDSPILLPQNDCLAIFAWSNQQGWPKRI